MKHAPGADPKGLTCWCAPPVLLLHFPHRVLLKYPAVFKVVTWIYIVSKQVSNTFSVLPKHRYHINLWLFEKKCTSLGTVLLRSHFTVLILIKISNSRSTVKVTRSHSRFKKFPWCRIQNHCQIIKNGLFVSKIEKKPCSFLTLSIKI